MFGTKYKGQTLAIDIVSISPSADEKTCAVTPQKSGSVTVTMKLVDANGNTLKNLAGEELISEQNLISKAGFFQKIIAFFKKLFGLTKTYPELFKSLFLN